MLPRSHPIARRLRALRGEPGRRDAEGVLVAEGIHLALEALASGARIEVAIVSPRLSDTDEGRGLARRLSESGVALHETTEATLDGLQDARSPQPVVLVVAWKPAALSAVVTGRGGTPLLVVACGVQEPGNLGALLRTADAAGATGFVATPGSAALTHPRAVRASMGAIFRMPVVEAELERVLEEVHSREFTVMGAEARGGVDCETVDWSGPSALLLGGEGAGLPDAALAAASLRVAVPMARDVESLSVNAAAAVLLFTAARKRRSLSSAG